MNYEGLEELMRPCTFDFSEGVVRSIDASLVFITLMSRPQSGSACSRHAHFIPNTRTFLRWHLTEINDTRLDIIPRCESSRIIPLPGFVDSHLSALLADVRLDGNSDVDLSGSFSPTWPAN